MNMRIGDAAKVTRLYPQPIPTEEKGPKRTQNFNIIRPQIRRQPQNQKLSPVLGKRKHSVAFEGAHPTIKASNEPSLKSKTVHVGRQQRGQAPELAYSDPVALNPIKAFFSSQEDQTYPPAKRRKLSHENIIAPSSNINETNHPSNSLILEPSALFKAIKARSQSSQDNQKGSEQTVGSLLDSFNKLLKKRNEEPLTDADIKSFKQVKAGIKEAIQSGKLNGKDISQEDKVALKEARSIAHEKKLEKMGVKDADKLFDAFYVLTKKKTQNKPLSDKEKKALRLISKTILKVLEKGSFGGEKLSDSQRVRLEVAKNMQR